MAGPVGGLPEAAYPDGVPSESAWTLTGIISNERYVTRPEKTDLVAKQEGLGRPAATLGALIPIRKNAAWWALTQDERRAVFEDQSAHIALGIRAFDDLLGALRATPEWSYEDQEVEILVSRK